MDFKSVWRRWRRLLLVPLLLLSAGTPASAIIGLTIIAAVVLYLVSLLVRTAFISKYVLMLLITINPCIIDPCPSYRIGSWIIPAGMIKADPVVQEINADLLAMFHSF
ncbi:MAG: hypothetical protein PHG85_04490 [Candidatus Altiarchaeota archaeon]|nr:hypothetical protein [Candidatus Altiarchaeota archaeon]